MRKIQMDSAHMVMPTMKDCSHSPSRDHISISMSRASKSATLSAKASDVSDTAMPDALLTTLWATSNTPITIFHVLETMSTAQAVLKIHLKNIQVSTSLRLFRSVMS